MSKAVIRDGRWVTEEEQPLQPWEANQLHLQVDRIHAFAHGVTKLTHDKVEILTHILDATPEQEKAILKILKLSKEQINLIL